MSRRGALLFAAMCVIWGVPYLMIRVAVRELAPVTLVFFRTALGAVLLVPFAAWRGDLRPLLARWWPLLAYTVIEVAIPWVLLAQAETKLTSSLTGPADRGRAARRRGGRRADRDARAAGQAPLARAARRDRRRRCARRARRRAGGCSSRVVEIGCVAVCYAVGPIILSRRLRTSRRSASSPRRCCSRRSCMRRSRRPLAVVDAVGARGRVGARARRRSARRSRSSSSSR